MNIKQASEQSGVSAPNIRFYEKEGLLTPARRQGNDYRDYTAGNVRTLKLIRMLRMLDVPLPTIKAVLRGEQPLQQALQAQQTVLVHMTDCNNSRIKIRCLIRIRLMEHSFISLAGRSWFICINSWNNHQFIFYFFIDFCQTIHILTH